VRDQNLERADEMVCAVVLCVTVTMTLWMRSQNKRIEFFPRFNERNIAFCAGGLEGV